MNSVHRARWLDVGCFETLICTFIADLHGNRPRSTNYWLPDPDMQMQTPKSCSRRGMKRCASRRSAIPLHSGLGDPQCSALARCHPERHAGPELSARRDPIGRRIHLHLLVGRRIAVFSVVSPEDGTRMLRARFATAADDRHQVRAELRTLLTIL